MTCETVPVEPGSLVLDGAAKSKNLDVEKQSEKNGSKCNGEVLTETKQHKKRANSNPWFQMPSLVDINCCGDTAAAKKDDDMSESTISDKSQEQEEDPSIPHKPDPSTNTTNTQPPPPPSSSSWMDCFSFQEMEKTLLDWNSFCGTANTWRVAEGPPPTIDVASSPTNDGTPPDKNGTVLVTHFLELEAAPTAESTVEKEKKGLVTFSLQPLEDTDAKEVTDTLLNKQDEDIPDNETDDKVKEVVEVEKLEEAETMNEVEETEEENVGDPVSTSDKIEKVEKECTTTNSVMSYILSAGSFFEGKTNDADATAEKDFTKVEETEDKEIQTNQDKELKDEPSRDLHDEPLPVGTVTDEDIIEKLRKEVEPDNQDVTCNEQSKGENESCSDQNKVTKDDDHDANNEEQVTKVNKEKTPPEQSRSKPEPATNKEPAVKMTSLSTGQYETTAGDAGIKGADAVRIVSLLAGVFDPNPINV